MDTRNFPAVCVSVMLLIIAVLAFATKPEAPRVISETEPTAILVPTATPKLVTINYSKRDLDCMQKNLYFEARTESDKGMQAVALVTLNRVKTKHFPSTVCGVVEQSAIVKKTGRRVCQFSWMCDGKSDSPNMQHAAEAKAWERAGRVAKAALEGKVPDFLGNATHYHADYVEPSWSKASRIKELAQVGTHIFYKDVLLKLKA